jgi:aspartyl protease family protein
MLKRLLLASALTLPIATDAVAQQWETWKGSPRDSSCRQLTFGTSTLPAIFICPKQVIPQAPQSASLRRVGDHFFALVTINNVRLIMMVDTGATEVSLSYEDARKVGYDPNTLHFNAQSSTPNGSMPIALLTVPYVSVEGFGLRNVFATCCTNNNESLLGMSALNRFKITIDGEQMILTPR